MADVEMASVLIESWAFVPYEARKPRLVVRPIEPDGGTRQSRPAPEEGPWYLVTGLAEVAVANDGSVWYGPAVEGAVTDGAWTAGTLVRYARNDGATGDGFLVEIQQTLGRDFRLGRVAFEPRVGFSLRTMQRSGSATWISPCGRLSCLLPDGTEIQTPKTDDSSVQMSLGARTTLVVDVVDSVSVWASFGLATAVAGRVDRPNQSSREHELTLGRFGAGARFRL
jgi:hypothetical protein